MQRFNWRFMFIITLLVLSVLIYYIHYLIFRDLHHIFLYLIGDIAFLFIQVLIVTIILQKLLEEREKSALLKKLNMVIGAFFSEVGTSLLAMLSRLDIDSCTISEQMILSADWTKGEFARACRLLDDRTYRFHCSREDLMQLRTFLHEKRDFFLRLLENPNLLEHETFTELLWSAFHLTEELTARMDLLTIPDTDLEHLAGDIQRVYKALTKQWLAYMEHLRTDYPFLYSFAIRTNPFNPGASVEIGE